MCPEKDAIASKVLEQAILLRREVPSRSLRQDHCGLGIGRCGEARGPEAQHPAGRTG